MRALFKIALALVAIFWAYETYGPYDFRLEGTTLSWYPKGVSEASVGTVRKVKTVTYNLSGATPKSHTPVKASGETLPPVGHYDYCKRNPEECRSVTATGPMLLTKERMKQLHGVRDWVRTNIKQVTDVDININGDPEYWQAPWETLDREEGDCEDHALLTRYFLLDMGWEPSMLLMAVVKKPDGEGHAVLIVRGRNSQGEINLILDNLDQRILKVEETNYKFLKRQSPRHAGKWESINDSRILVSAVAIQ